MVRDQNFQSPNNAETAVLDAMFLLKTGLSKLPGTLSAIAKLILYKALSLTKHQTDLCIDVYTSPSIKDIKQRTSGNINSEMSLLFGPGMKTPKDIFNLLKLNDFKKELLRFFITENYSDEYAIILGNKVLYCSVDNKCKKFSTINGLIKVENVPELYGEYLKAYTRVAFYAKYVDETNSGNIVLSANDTEIMIVLLTNAKKSYLVRLWFRFYEY